MPDPQRGHALNVAIGLARREDCAQDLVRTSLTLLVQLDGVDGIRG
ncbi:hypothetical protein AB0H94_35475 [Streptomyces purpurascens]